MDRDSLLIQDDVLTENTGFANIIIKNCITKLSASHDSIKHYKADCYINGRLIPDNVSGFMDKIVYRFDKIHISELENQVISQELFTTLEYKSPTMMEKAKAYWIIKSTICA